jgi:hypothetical protein
MAEIGQGSHDPVIAPPGIFSGHSHDKIDKFPRYRRSARHFAKLRPIELLRNEPTIPGEYRLRLGDNSNFAESLTAETLADFRRAWISEDRSVANAAAAMRGGFYSQR